METPTDLQAVSLPTEPTDDPASVELLGSAGYFVRTDLRAGASCNSHRDMSGKCFDCK